MLTATEIIDEMETLRDLACLAASTESICNRYRGEGGLNDARRSVLSCYVERMNELAGHLGVPMEVRA